jgi:hypothetical protein
LNVKADRQIGGCGLVGRQEGTGAARDDDRDRDNSARKDSSSSAHDSSSYMVAVCASVPR